MFQTDEEIISYVKNSIEEALKGSGKLCDESLLASGILNFFGMSGKRTRILLNNLAGKKGIKYAEVGTHKGSTLLSVMFKNDPITALCCDNWSEFNGPQEEFLKNVRTFMSTATSTQTLSIFSCDYKELEFGADPWSKIDFYNFDGPHTQEDQFEGIVRAYPGLSDRFILFVDDWNWKGTQVGTHSALNALQAEILFKLEVTTQPENYDDTGSLTNRFQKSDWHNGVAIFACKKKNNSQG